ncbi:MAG: OmpH family outer membrane protein [Bacteroidales bacterium]
MKKLFILIAVISFAGISSIQAQKFGHINFAELIQAMPERATAEEDYNKFVKGLEDQMAAIQKEAQAKFEEYQKYMQGTDINEDIKASKEGEINDLNQRLQAFQSSAQQQIQKKESDIMTPLIEKARVAVESVGKTDGFLYIFDVSSNTILYKGKNSVDVLPLVKKQLGIQ